jgi:fructose-1,6-bisphosphatase/inositol monophosphatase family enzyme
MIAQRITNSRQGADVVTPKAGIDLVTATDVLCEDAIRAELLRRFPNYPVIGEERGGTATKGASYWLVDPICGTLPFAFKIPIYSTNIALVENGIVTLAAVTIGGSGELLYAEKGHGTRMLTAAGESTAGVRADSNAILVNGKSERAAKVIHNALSLKRWYVWAFGSSVWYAYLAAGRIAGLIHFMASTEANASVHTAAGALVAAEAGAIVTDLDTQGEWRIDTRSFLVASSRALHDELRDLVFQPGRNPVQNRK